MFKYSSKFSFSSLSIVASLTSCLLSFTATGQERPTTKKAEELKEQISSTDKSDLSRESNSTLEHVAKQNAIAAASAQRADAALKIKRDRIVALQSLKAEYLNKVASGDIDPLQLWKDKIPELQQALPAIEQDYQSFVTTDDPLEKARLQSTLLAALQPVGFFLNNAPARKTDLSLSQDQVKEIHRVQDLQQNVALTEDLKLRGLSFSPLSARYTLLDLPIPLTLHAPADTKIYLQSTTGGRFPNGLAFIELDSGTTGVVTTSWVSHGDSIADNTFFAISSSGRCAHTISVKSLIINFPTELKDLIGAPKVSE